MVHATEQICSKFTSHPHTHTPETLNIANRFGHPEIKQPSPNKKTSCLQKRRTSNLPSRSPPRTTTYPTGSTPHTAPISLPHNDHKQPRIRPAPQTGTAPSAGSLGSFAPGEYRPMRFYSAGSSLANASEVSPISDRVADTTYIQWLWRFSSVGPGPAVVDRYSYLKQSAMFTTQAVENKISGFSHALRFPGEKNIASTYGRHNLIRSSAKYTFFFLSIIAMQIYFFAWPISRKKDSAKSLTERHVEYVYFPLVLVWGISRDFKTTYIEKMT